MTHALEDAINAWHDGVNSGDLAAAREAVGDPIVVLGPKGAGSIDPAGFAAWVERSGIRLTPRSWHPVSDRLMVVEEDAEWPGSERPTRVATLFRVHGSRVTAALRFPTLREALDLGFLYRELAASE